MPQQCQIIIFIRKGIRRQYNIFLGQYGHGLLMRAIHLETLVTRPQTRE